MNLLAVLQATTNLPSESMVVVASSSSKRRDQAAPHYACSSVHSQSYRSVPNHGNTTLDAWHSYYDASLWSEFLHSNQNAFIDIPETDSLYDLTVEFREFVGALNAFKDQYVSIVLLPTCV